jgi:hypothetical protein
MKTIYTKGISYIKPVPGATSEWYYGIDYDQGDLYEAEEIYKSGHTVKGRTLCLVHYPDGDVYLPLPKTEGQYSETPVYLDGGLYMINVDFPKSLIQIIRFDCTDHTVSVHAELPLSSVKDCYNLRLDISPLTLTRQSSGENSFDIVWPEKSHFRMEDHESFFLRNGDKLFFNRWDEEGDGEDYRYREETVVRDLSGNVLEVLPGDVMLMPDGEIWHLDQT